MNRLKSIAVSILRIIILLIAILGLAGTVYFFYPTGEAITDGRHDLETNGIWLQHGWLGDDEWFARYEKDPSQFRNDEALKELATAMQENGMTYLFPHLCPCSTNGRIAPVDPNQTERFLQQFSEFKTLPWIGGVLGKQCHLSSPPWRANFVSSTRALLEAHPNLAGVQVNIEPLPSGNTSFLRLLDELKAALPPGKILSVAAYPPPTRWQPSPEVHWEEDYFRKVAKRCDLMVPMMYDTSIRYAKVYEHLMKSWTREVLTWSGDTPVLLGLPAYEDAGTGYHIPEIENLEHALRGIHAGLSSMDELPGNYRGVCLYSEWEMTKPKWKTYRELFRRGDSN